MAFVRFMSSAAGRGLRIVAGAALVVAGVVVGGALGWALGLVGLVPFGEGMLNVCLLGPAFHGPLRATATARS